MVFDDPRPRRTRTSAAALHTFDEVPERLLKIPRQREPQMNITPSQRQAAAAQYGCEVWEVGPCGGCATLIHRYGRGSAYACRPCRARVTR